MDLIKNNTYSASALQTFLDCERKYELLYIKEIKWPALKYEPYKEIEEKMIRGQRFHHLIHQHHLGIDTDTLKEIALNMEIDNWWNNYIDFFNRQSNIKFKWSEINLTIPFGKNTLLTARYDLITLEEEKFFTIFDWKTSENRSPDKYILNRIQTKLYPLVLCETGFLNITDKLQIDPDMIKMVYWFANFPRNPFTISYSTNDYKNDKRYIRSLIDQIESKADGSFNKTSNINFCSYCNYRSLCDRGIKAININQVKNDQHHNENIFEIDLDSIGEIEY